MEIVTEALDPVKLASELLRVVDWLSRHRVQRLEVTFGCGAEVPSDQLWTPIRVDLHELCGFVRDAQVAASFTFGRADLHIYDAATLVQTGEHTFRCDYPGIIFSFCHESDLHFSAEDVELVEDVKREWIARGYKGHQSETDSTPRRWEPFG